MHIISQKKYAIAVLNSNKEAFIIHIAFLGLDLKILIYPAQKAQIASLLSKKDTILTKYLNFATILFKKAAAKLLNCFAINK